MSAQPNQPKRPWIVRQRVKSWRTGDWQRWRVHGTYATEERALDLKKMLNGNVNYSHGEIFVERRNGGS